MSLQLFMRNSSLSYGSSGMSPVMRSHHNR